MKYLFRVASFLLITFSPEANAAESPVSVSATSFDVKKEIPKTIVFEIKNHSKKAICIVQQDAPTSPKYPTVGLFSKRKNRFIERKKGPIIVSEGATETPNFIFVPPNSSHFSIQPIRNQFRIKNKHKPFDVELSFRFLNCEVLLQNEEIDYSIISRLYHLEKYRLEGKVSE